MIMFVLLLFSTCAYLHLNIESDDKHGGFITLVKNRWVEKCKEKCCGLVVNFICNQFPWSTIQTGQNDFRKNITRKDIF